VRSKPVRAGRARSLADDDIEERGRSGLFLLQALQWGRRDAVGFIVAAFATGAILINALFLQAGPHPAPMFKNAALIAPANNAANTPPVAALPRARPADQTASTGQPAQVRSTGEIIADIQRELTRRGYYDGSVDGLYGPKTDAAIRDFEQAAGLKPSSEPNEVLFRAIQRSNVKKAGAVPAPAARVMPATPVRAEPTAERPTASKRVMAVQRALTEFGYGQIRQTGVLDTDTQAAIEKFERDRKLPVTRQVSDRLARELASMTGRPLE
jgi:peptidoglycan hydrolase-like protein with peptidoglycan-binding domain